MTLLELDRVTKQHRIGRRDVVPLRDASFDVAAGELVAVFGLVRLERIALLRICAGLDAPDTGTVRFDGHEVGTDRRRLLQRGVALCTADFSVAGREAVADHVAVPARLRGASRRAARLAAHSALERVGAATAAAEDPSYLTPADTTRVMLARGLVSEPRLLLVDDPVRDVDPAEKDRIVETLRTLTDGGIAVVATAAQLLVGVTRTLSLSAGTLSGETHPRSASVHELPTRRTRSSA